MSKFQAYTTIYSGSLKAICNEIKHGNVFTVIDEIWHTRLFEWMFPTMHYYYCQWAWKKRSEGK